MSDAQVVITIHGRKDASVETAIKAAKADFEGLDKALKSLGSNLTTAAGSVANVATALGGLSSVLKGFGGGDSLRSSTREVKAFAAALGKLTATPVSQVGAISSSLQQMDSANAAKAAQDVSRLAGALNRLASAPDPKKVNLGGGGGPAPAAGGAAQPVTVDNAQLREFARVLAQINTRATNANPPLKEIVATLHSLTISRQRLQEAGATVRDLARDVRDLVAALRQLNSVPRGGRGGSASPSSSAAAAAAGAGGAAPPSGTPPGSGRPGGGAHGAGSDVMQFRMQLMALEGAMSSFSALAAQAGIALAGLGAGLAFLGRNIIQRSAEFEVFRNKLVTVLHSTTIAEQTMARAVKFAAVTPFDVAGIVDATTTLEVYGQRSKEILPLVANLAAGMGKDIRETGLVVAKALSGSLDGFRSLRNQFGITTAKLHEFGTQIDSQGRLMIRTADQLDRVRKAFRQIVELNFGTAIARQIETFTGIMSNAEDAVTRLSVLFGNALLPTAKMLALGFTGVVEIFERLPRPLVQIILIGGIVTAALAAIGGAGLLLVAGLLMVGVSVINLVGQLALFSVSAATGGAASVTFATGLGVLTGAFAAARIAVAGFIATIAPMMVATVAYGAILASIGVILQSFEGDIGGVVSPTLAWSGAIIMLLPLLISLAPRLLAVGKALATLALAHPVIATLTLLAAAVGAAVFAARNFEAAYRDMGMAIKDTGNQMKLALKEWALLRDAIQSANPAATFTAFATSVTAAAKDIMDGMAGLNAVQIMDALNAKGIKTFQDLELHAKEAQDRFRALGVDITSLQAIFDKGGVGVTDEEKASLKARFGTDDINAIGIEGILTKLQELRAAYPIIESLAKAFGIALDAVRPFKDAVDDLNTRFESLRKFAQFADKLGDIDSQSAKIRLFTQLLADASRELAKFGAGGTRPDALRILADPKASAQAKEAAEAYLKIDSELTESVHKDKKRRIADLQNFISEQSEVRNVSIEEQIAQNQKELDVAREGVVDPELEHTALQRRRALFKKKHDEQIQDQKNFIQENLAYSKQFIADQKAQNEMSAAEEVKAQDRIIAGLKQYQKDNADLLANEPALAKTVGKAILAATIERNGILRREQQDNYARLQDIESRFLEDSNLRGHRSLKQKIADEQTLLDYDTAAFRQKAINEQQYFALRQRHEKAIVRMTEERIERDKKAALYLKKQGADLLGDAVKERQDKLRKDLLGGKDVQGEIVAAAKAQMALKLQIMKAEQDEEIRLAGGSQAGMDAINKKYALQRQSYLRGVTAEFKKLIKDETDEAKKQAVDLAAIHKSFDSSRMGGAGSPLISMEELQATQAAKFGSAFSLDPEADKRKATPQVDKLQQFVAAVERMEKDLVDFTKIDTSITNLGTTISNLATAVDALTNSLSGKEGDKAPGAPAPGDTPEDKTLNAAISSANLDLLRSSVGGFLNGGGLLPSQGPQSFMNAQSNLAQGFFAPAPIATVRSAPTTTPAGASYNSVSVPVSLTNQTDPNAVGAAVASAMRQANNSPNSRGYLGVV